MIVPFIYIRFEVFLSAPYINFRKLTYHFPDVASMFAGNNT